VETCKAEVLQLKYERRPARAVEGGGEKRERKKQREREGPGGDLVGRRTGRTGWAKVVCGDVPGSRLYWCVYPKTGPGCWVWER
jgi:hypothetical protein